MRSKARLRPCVASSTCCSSGPERSGRPSLAKCAASIMRRYIAIAISFCLSGRRLFAIAFSTVIYACHRYFRFVRVYGNFACMARDRVEQEQAYA